MKNGIIIYLCAALLSAFYVNANSIQVSGDIWGVWDPANNPYEVTGDLRVPIDSSLTILPGCSIQFYGLYKMTIDTLAKITAVGTEDDSIYFIPIDTSTGWGGIRLYDADTATLFSYCSFGYRKNITGDYTSGAIYMLNGSLKIDNCYFYKNHYGTIKAESHPPHNYTKVSLIYCVFEQNNPEGGVDGWGGVLYIDEGTAMISDCVFIQNKGGVIMCFGNSTVSKSIFLDNLGIPIGQYWGSTFNVDHNIISRNTSDWIMPSAIMAQEVFGPVIITNNTMCNNVNGSDMYNGVCAIWNEHTGTTAYLTNNILWGDSSVPLIGNDGNCTININYSDIRGGYAGTGNIDADPLFVDTTNADYRLRWDSPCIDAGDPNSPLDPNGTRADMGALPPFIPEFTLYLPGDISGDWQRLGGDVTYGVRYFKGLGSQPPDSFYNESTGTWVYAAADVNGDCFFRGADITYLVGYFKSINPVLKWCPQTPPF